MKNNYAKLIGVIVITLVILVLIFFLSQDLVWTGKLEFTTDFRKFTSFASILKPQGNIEIKDKMAYIKQEPVWFDIYLPRDFEKARLEFTYKNGYNSQIEVGPKIYEANNPLQILDDGLKPENGLITKSLEFDLKDLPISQGKLRFMISVPELLDEQKGIYIRELNVSLSRRPIWRENFWENLIKYYNYYENKFR